MAKGAGKGPFWQKEQHFQRYEAASHTLGKMERVWQMQLCIRVGQILRGLESLVFSVRALRSQGRAYAKGGRITFAR